MLHLIDSAQIVNDGARSLSEMSGAARRESASAGVAWRMRAMYDGDVARRNLPAFAAWSPCAILISAFGADEVFGVDAEAAEATC